MNPIVYINVLKPGKLQEYRAFCEEFLGPRKAEYTDLMKRYGLKNVKTYYHKSGDTEFILVYHDAEEGAFEKLKNFPNSDLPFDQWFLQNLKSLHEFEHLDKKVPEELFIFQPEQKGPSEPIVFVNPLKKGMYEEYKTFCSTNLGPRKEEYIDLLKRYGLKTAKVYYHKLGDKELIIVFHDIEDNALELLKDFTSSDHPYDLWFVEQLTMLHDFKEGEETSAEHLFSFTA